MICVCKGCGLRVPEDIAVCPCCECDHIMICEEGDE